MLLRLTPEQNGYDVVFEAIKDRFEDMWDSMIVQLKTKHYEDEEWDDTTELLINDGFDWEHPHWEWETDWWEGERFIDLVAAAKITDIDISESFAFDKK